MVRLGWDDDDEEEEEGEEEEEDDADGFVEVSAREIAGEQADDADEEDDAMGLARDEEDDHAMPPLLLEASAAEDAEMGETTGAEVDGGSLAMTPAVSRDVEVMRSALRLRSASAQPAYDDALLASLGAPPPAPPSERRTPRGPAGMLEMAPRAETLVFAAARRDAFAEPLVPTRGGGGADGSEQTSFCAWLLQGAASGARGSADALRVLAHAHPLSWGPDGQLLTAALHPAGPRRGRPEVRVHWPAGWRTADGGALLEAVGGAGVGEARAAMAEGANTDAADAGSTALVPAAPAVAGLGRRRARSAAAMLEAHRVHVACARAPSDGAEAAGARAARVSALCDAFGAAEALGAPPARAADARTPSAAERAWQLVSAVWGVGGCHCVPSEEAVARWLRALAADTAREAIARAEAEAVAARGPDACADPLLVAFHHLSCLDVAAAVRAARNGGYARVASLLALAGSGSVAAAAAAAQRQLWASVGARPRFVPDGVSRLLALLAGDVRGADARAHELSWPQALGVCWWFETAAPHGGGDGGGDGGGGGALVSADCVPNRSLAHALRRYDEGVHEGVLQPPRPRHTRGGGGGGGGGFGNAEAARADDLLFGLLRLAVEPLQPLPAVLSPYGLSAHPCRALTPWCLHEVLTRVVGLRPLDAATAAALRGACAAELLASSEWPAAVYVAAQRRAASAAASAEGAEGASAELDARQRAAALRILASHARPPPTAPASADAADAAGAPSGAPYSWLPWALDEASAARTLSSSEARLLEMFDELPAGAAVLSRAQVCAAVHAAKACAAGARAGSRAELPDIEADADESRARVRTHCYHLLAARRWAAAHALVCAQLAPRALVEYAEGSAARAELRALLAALAEHSAEVGPGWSGAGLVYARALQLLADVTPAPPPMGADPAADAAALRLSAQHEASALELLRALGGWSAQPQPLIQSAGPCPLPSLGGHAGLGGHAPWFGLGPCHEVVRAKLCDAFLVARERSLGAEGLDGAEAEHERAGRSLYLTEALARARLPSDTRQQVGWLALDEFLGRGWPPSASA